MPMITMSARRLAIISAALLSALGAAGLVAQQVRAQRPAVAAPARPALSVSTTRPQAHRLPLTVAANGSITAWQEASVGSEASGWRLAEVLVNVGDTVKRGQPLARFAAEMVRAELAQSRAGLAEAEAVAAEAAANAGRARELQSSGALSAQQIQQLLTAERTASARVEALRAALEVHKLRLAQTEVLAPDDGIVSARMATVGAVVPAGQELFRLIRGGRLEWRAEVAATEIAAIKPGQAVRVQPAGAPALVGRVRMLAPTVDAATMNVSAWSHPQPDSGGDAVRDADAGRPAGLPGHEGAELPRHRPAHGHRHRQRCPAPGAGAAGNRGGAQDRELVASLQGSSTSTPRCRTAWPPSRPSSGWKSPRRRRWTTCATRCRACAPTCRPTCATR
jgi:RND family efflux transporter MFP subunit